MPRIRYTPESGQDLQRLSQFFLDNAPEIVSKAILTILESIDQLANMPELGRPYPMDAGIGYRELVITFGRSGYLALYQFDAQTDVVDILAIRSQRELNY